MWQRVIEYKKMVEKKKHLIYNRLWTIVKNVFITVVHYSSILRSDAGN